MPNGARNAASDARQMAIRRVISARDSVCRGSLIPHLNGRSRGKRSECNLLK
jgi:hypothetical protein